MFSAETSSAVKMPEDAPGQVLWEACERGPGHGAQQFPSKIKEKWAKVLTAPSPAVTAVIAADGAAEPLSGWHAAATLLSSSSPMDSAPENIS